MSNRVIVEDVNHNNSIRFDFDEKLVYFFRKGWASESLKLVDIAIPFKKITAIELIRPTLFKSGRIALIVEGNRLLAEDKFDNNASEMFVNNSEYSPLYDAVIRLKKERPEIELVTSGHLNVPKTKNQKDYAIDVSGNTTSSSYLKNTYRKKCQVCGHIFCYTSEDLKNNERLARGAAASSFGALFGPAMLSATNNQTANDKLSRIVDYNKCPHCGSRDIDDATDEDIEKNKAAQGTPISSADELKKYKELLDMGAITQEEFDAKKKQLLGL